jgi:predicted ArsR family transcriptional regulator
MSVDDEGLNEQIAGVSSLNEPVRRKLYQVVAKARDPIGREQAAEMAGISRALAAFHLDKLAEEGLLETTFRRLTDRSGPGAGRPSKLYRRSSNQLQVNLPPRRYELAARLLARAMTEKGRQSPKRTLQRVAKEFGKEVGVKARQRAGAEANPVRLIQAGMSSLENYGFEPYVAEDGAIRLRNCPFHALAADFRGLVCGMNLDLMKGVVEGLSGTGLAAELDPQPGLCCVAFRSPV